MKAIHLSERLLQRLELFMDVRERMDIEVDAAGRVCDCDACRANVRALERHDLVECSTEGGELRAALSPLAILVLTEAGSA
jgi:hypothetical protein